MTSQRLRRSIHCGLCLLAIAAPASRGQEPRRLAEAESVPTDLAAALIAAGGFGGEPQIQVGGIPEWIANRLYVPPGARVLGSAFLGTTLVGVVSLAQAPDSALAQVKEQLLQRGWKNPPVTPRYGGGFVPANVGAPNTITTRVSLCSDQQVVVVSAARRRGATTDITYRVSSTPGYSICRPPEMPPGAMRSPFPTLYNPPNAADGRMTGDCSSSMFGSSGTGTTLRTSMTPEQLLEHYAKQLTDSGWNTPPNGAPILGRSWTRADSTGAPIELTITVTTSTRDPNCRDLNLQVRTLRKP